MPDISITLPGLLYVVSTWCCCIAHFTRVTHPTQRVKAPLIWTCRERGIRPTGTSSDSSWTL